MLVVGHGCHGSTATLVLMPKCVKSFAMLACDAFEEMVVHHWHCVHDQLSGSMPEDLELLS